MPSRKAARKYPYRQQVKLRSGETIHVRYAIDWDQDRLASQVRRARSNSSGKSTSGPIQVIVHPDDRPTR